MKKIADLSPKKNLGAILFISALLLFVYATIAAFFSSSSLDQRVFDLIAPHITSSRTSIMLVISFMANHLFMIPAISALVIYLIVKKNYAVAIKIAAVVLSAIAVLSLEKRLIHRHRPSDPLVINITNYSFPSGHSMMSLAVYGLMIMYAAKSIKNENAKRWVIAGLIILIIIIGISRIYLRMHYTTDVLAGWSMGIMWLMISVKVIDRIQDNYKVSHK